MAAAHEADPSSISRLTVLLQDQGNRFEVRDSSAGTLVQIAQRHPDYRQQCIAILTAALERYPRNPIELNTSLVAHLIELKAKESAAMIKQVIDAGEYDHRSVGNWQEVSRALGTIQAPPAAASPPPPAS